MPNLFPTSIPTADAAIVAPETTQNQVAFGRSWKFDFAKGEFVLSPTGRVHERTDTDAWLEWCIKALSTQRFRYPIYSHNYGEEYTYMLGKSYPQAVAESEIRRMTTECLMIDSRTASVESFSFSWQDDAVYFTCIISNVHGETRNVQGEVVIY